MDADASLNGGTITRKQFFLPPRSSHPNVARKIQFVLLVIVLLNGFSFINLVTDVYPLGAVTRLTPPDIDTVAGRRPFHATRQE
jgi:hypothetical protein